MSADRPERRRPCVSRPARISIAPTPGGTDAHARESEAWPYPRLDRTLRERQRACRPPAVWSLPTKSCGTRGRRSPAVPTVMPTAVVSFLPLVVKAAGRSRTGQPECPP